MALLLSIEKGARSPAQIFFGLTAGAAGFSTLSHCGERPERSKAESARNAPTVVDYFSDRPADRLAVHAAARVLVLLPGKLALIGLIAPLFGLVNAATAGTPDFDFGFAAWRVPGFGEYPR